MSVRDASSDREEHRDVREKATDFLVDKFGRTNQLSI
jgi:hypothetical protein